MQLITSCFPTCGDPGIYENIYNSVWIEAYDNSGFYSKPIVDSVYKNAFGLSVGLNFETNQIGMNTLQFNSLFSSAFANECESPTFTYPDPVKLVLIYVTNTQTGEKTDASSYFGMEDYYGNELITLEQFFIQREEWHDGFQFQLVNWDSIPNSAIFTAEAYLESGIVFMNQTKQINFYQ
jgi:hypothetical protein